MQNPSSGRLELLYRISQTINSSLDLNTVLDVLIDESIQVTRAERGFLMLFDGDKKLSYKTARGMEQRNIEESDFQISRGAAERVAKEGISLLTSNAQMDERLDKRASVKLYGLRSILCVPIRHKEQVLGVVYVDNHFQNGIFSQADLELLESIAASAGIAIENARLYQVAVEKGRMERELQVARAVQARLIPPETPRLAGWDFAACWKPAHEVSGDFYDFLNLPGGRLGLVVADVSDKGMPAALFMALSRSILRAVIGRGDGPAADISQASRLIWQDTAAEMYITLFHASLAADNPVITYVNAGHNPPLLCRVREHRLEQLERTGMAAGVEADTPYEQKSLTLEKGDSLLIYTDGVSDAAGPQGPYGETRIREAFQKYCGLGARQMIAAIERELTEFCGDEIPFDDITMLAIKRSA